ncbi:hypothetical protein V2J09_021998 [Rumex salicifolius]
MDNHFFLNAGMPPQLHFDQPELPTWHSLVAMDVHLPDLQFPPPPPTQSSDCFFDSAITSMVSSPVSASNSNESFVIRELIGKLGNICNSGGISSPAVNPPATIAGDNSSCYSTPLSSPPKINIGSINRAIMENFNTHLGNSIDVPPLGSSLPAMPGDPGFVERAARFSSFGSRSFNGRNTHLPCPNSATESPTRFAGGAKLHRVSSSPSINGAENRNRACSKRVGNEFVSKPGNDLNPNSRKRKSFPKGKCRDIPCSSPAKVVGNGIESNEKRSKLNEEINDGKTEQNLEEDEEDHDDDEIKKQSGNNTNQKPSEPPKDYIHVRARRGQATDSHSLAERVRREKISERMKLLQDLVPGCNKVTGKALMLEEIINYVQSLQGQVEFLSMKLASVNPRLEFNTDNHFKEDAFQPNCSIQTFPLDTLAPTLYPQNPLQQNGITGSGMGPPCSNSMDPINQSHDLQLPTMDGFNNGVPELCEGDLHTLVQMGFAQNTNLVKDRTFQPQSLHGSNQAPAMKTEF